MKNKRLAYFLVFIALFVIEVIIALFVRDSFIRPFLGDVLVVALIASFMRIIFPKKPQLLPIYATLFAFAVEILQYFDIVLLLGLSDNPVISTVIGRTFDFSDLICYLIGGLLFLITEIILSKITSSREKSDG